MYFTPEPKFQKRYWALFELRSNAGNSTILRIFHAAISMDED